MLPFHALAEGFVEITVSFTGEEGEVRASKIIGVYKPLMVSKVDYFKQPSSFQNYLLI